MVLMEEVPVDAKPKHEEKSRGKDVGPTTPTVPTHIPATTPTVPTYIPATTPTVPAQIVATTPVQVGSTTPISYTQMESETEKVSQEGNCSVRNETSYSFNTMPRDMDNITQINDSNTEPEQQQFLHVRPNTENVTMNVRLRKPRFVGDGHVGKVSIEELEKTPVNTTMIHCKQLIILRYANLEGNTMACTISPRLFTEEEQAMQLEKWKDRANQTVVMDSVEDFMEVVEECFKTEEEQRLVFWTLTTLIAGIAPGKSHCSCERIFRRCLSSVDTFYSKVLYQFYFAVLYPPDTCVARWEMPPSVNETELQRALLVVVNQLQSLSSVGNVNDGMWSTKSEEETKDYVTEEELREELNSSVKEEETKDLVTEELLISTVKEEETKEITEDLIFTMREEETRDHVTEEVEEEVISTVEEDAAKVQVIEKVREELVSSLEVVKDGRIPNVEEVKEEEIMNKEEVEAEVEEEGILREEEVGGGLISNVEEVKEEEIMNKEEVEEEGILREEEVGGWRISRVEEVEEEGSVSGEKFEEGILRKEDVEDGRIVRGEEVEDEGIVRRGKFKGGILRKEDVEDGRIVRKEEVEDEGIVRGEEVEDEGIVRGEEVEDEGIEERGDFDQKRTEDRLPSFSTTRKLVGVGKTRHAKYMSTTTTVHLHHLSPPPLSSSTTTFLLHHHSPPPPPLQSTTTFLLHHYSPPPPFSTTTRVI
ncbi:hypothetical protein Pmani_036567 [Petrolisthes manimaculis]|uniref:Uncharacterized protein n=1 Tax=Petrolisthes manimaculis TaxID=1843537 RepID=A0AAE1TMJ5_9EUCA|nr:hypothetical protein Pmani_036567 [Petrolisthes manimaculis]